MLLDLPLAKAVYGIQFDFLPSRILTGPPQRGYGTTQLARARGHEVAQFPRIRTRFLRLHRIVPDVRGEKHIGFWMLLGIRGFPTEAVWL